MNEMRSSTDNVMSGEQLRTLLYMMLRGDVELPIEQVEKSRPKTKPAGSHVKPESLLDEEA